ncbi:MAG: hypothetical protein IKF64_01115, partial [Eubacterium sp.]|nr:hypothetical protein [Eubacterium sp.]
LYNTSTKAYDYVCSTKENHAEFYNLKKNSAYKYKIRAVLSLADGTKVYGDKSNAYTAYTYPAKPTLNSVKKAKKKKKLTVKWKKVSGVSGYQVQWSTNKSFSKNKKSVYVSYKNASKTITTAKSKKKYYVRVRAYKTLNGKKVYSYWSTTKSAKTK